MNPALRINGQEVSPQAFYAVACDPRRPVVVEACAGAGKTWMLVSRILRALLDGAQPQEILAITFTKKAAAEMRDRLDEWLGKFARAQAPERIDELCRRGCTLAQALELEPRLAVLHEQVLNSGRSVEIRTFHSWFTQLLRTAPLALLQELRLHPQMQLLEDSSELHPVLWRRLMRRVRSEVARVADLEALIQTYGRSSTQQWLMNILQRRVEFELADQHGVLDSGVESAASWYPEFAHVDQPLDVLRDAQRLQQLRSLAQELGQAGAGTTRKNEAAQRIVLALEASGTEAMWSHLSKALFSDAGSLRQLGDSALLRQVQAWVESLRDAVAQQQAHEAHLRLVRLGRLLLEEYAALKRERGVADMPDLELCALHLLSNSQMSAWVQERLDARIRHVLIDEFQDTSPLQWHALYVWLSAYAGAGGGAQGAPSVFIVGDPKQSVYHFRGAEPQVFIEAQALVREGLGGDVLSSDHTRRNAQAVIDTLNTVFGAPDQAKVAAGAFRPHTTGSDVPGQVLRLPPVQRPAGEKTQRQGHRAALESSAPAWRDALTQARSEPKEALRLQEVRQVAAAIGELIQRGYEPGDIHVLSRKRKHLQQLAEVLRAAGIAYAQPDDSALMDSPLVRDVVALLDALVSPAHNLSLAQALRSPIFGASDTDLMMVATTAGQCELTWSAALEQLDAQGLASGTLARAQALLRPWRAAALTLPPHDLLERIVSSGQLRERYAMSLPAAMREVALEHLDALLGQSLDLDGGRYATPYNFVRALRQRAIIVPMKPRLEAVQLLTIHSAKGLEARAVFLLDTDPERSKPDTAALLVEWPPEHPAPRRVAFVASSSRIAPSLRDAMQAELDKRAQEERNALYVAMTRAKELLVLSSTEPWQSGPSAVWQAHLQGLALTPWTIAPRLLPEAGVRAGETAAVIHTALPQWRAVPEVDPQSCPEEAPLGFAEQRTALGQAVHRVMEWASGGDEAQGYSGEALMRAVHQAVSAFGLPAAAAPEVRAVVERILGKPELSHLFDRRRLHWAGNEVVVSHEGQVLRIDRLVCVERDGHKQWWVLDYKLNPAPHELQAYRQQLSRYARAIREMQPDDEVIAAFVTANADLLVLS